MAPGQWYLHITVQRTYIHCDSDRFQHHLRPPCLRQLTASRANSAPISLERVFLRMGGYPQEWGSSPNSGRLFLVLECIYSARTVQVARTHGTPQSRGLPTSPNSRDDRGGTRRPYGYRDASPRDATGVRRMQVLPPIQLLGISEFGVRVFHILVLMRCTNCVYNRFWIKESLYNEFELRA
ncbi:hypothetical protein BDP27DRAFT_424544 [Rhodocollybia butyracea]|uniref:Uncharacterized protein n=1 Tax=Rhodocollybia butyracea TaxID=206335 RepID=A0A9P5UBL2_9AGAR|nr:hypothetical protein BDP27DRAFT_424544 [Rhodocollybia butyracea]